MRVSVPASGLMLLCALTLTACKDQPPAPAAAPPAASAPVASPQAEAQVEAQGKPVAAAGVDAWLGKWTGPEGTWLQIEGSGGNYVVTIRNLDSTIRYPATSVLDEIRFDRAGAMATIRATDGAATGMKWLADKKNCLTIKTGEGYCRD